MTVRYRIDEGDRIVATGGDWDAFAAENGGVPPVVGRPLWDFVAGEDVGAVWQLLLRRARTSGRPVIFTYRCDGPGQLRVLRMRLVADERGGVEFDSTLVEEMPASVLSGVWRTGAPATLTVCGWCGRARRDDRWVEPDAVLALESVAPPLLSHGICADCSHLLGG